jgi:pantoate--beta-alanine ligase
MIVTGSIAEIRLARWHDPSLSWGLVPTMGFLHEGHLSLVRRAGAENERIAVTIYVNPTQFGPNEDLATYPRNVEADLAKLAKENVDLVFTPTNQTIYPGGFQTRVTVQDISRALEGASRPGHFQGVTTVVAKLFNIFQPARTYFGQKDAQQVAVIRRMAADLNFNLEVVVCPTVREEDGLAMSSRNARLSAEQREASIVLYQALSAASQALQDGQRYGQALRRIMSDWVTTEPLARLDYISAADPLTLAEVDIVEHEILLSLAVFFGEIRLIDNMLLEDLQPV